MVQQFNTNAEEAMNYYVSVFKDSKIISIQRYTDGPLEGPMKDVKGKVLTGVFQLAGRAAGAKTGLACRGR